MTLKATPRKLACPSPFPFRSISIVPSANSTPETSAIATLLPFMLPPFGDKWTTRLPFSSEELDSPLSTRKLLPSLTLARSGAIARPPSAARSFGGFGRVAAPVDGGGAASGRSGGDEVQE